MDMHNILNKIIQSLNPATMSTQPEMLFNTFKEAIREGAVGKFPQKATISVPKAVRTMKIANNLGYYLRAGKSCFIVISIPIRDEKQALLFLRQVILFLR